MAENTRGLRVITPNDRPPARKRKVLTKIVDSLDGSARDVLASMRLALAKKLDAGEIASNAIASAYKELRELDRQIRALDADRDEGVTGGNVEDTEFDATAI